MLFDFEGFHIDCRSHHGDDGLFHAQARITRLAADGQSILERHESGDIDAFDNDGDALACAREWALDWCREHAA